MRCCILPPHMLEELVKRGNKTQQLVAINSLGLDTTHRTQRIAAQAVGVRTAPTVTAAAPSSHRTIYTADGTENLPGVAVRTEGQMPAGNDPAANEAYNGLWATFIFYWSVLERNSIDGNGMHLNATVHYGKYYDNAFWDGQQMVFGDGDGDLFNRFTISLDVIGHELTHGVTAAEVNLSYANQSGALNESISDVFGSLVKQYALKQNTSQADWLIGKGLLRNSSEALRSMKAPGTAYDDPMLGKDPQPADMRHYVRTARDNGGVHINSGIPNRAFYLVAAALGGNAWDAPGQIWYDTIQDKSLRPNASFESFANHTALNAGKRYSSGSTQRKAVVDAWNTVGIRIR